MALPEGRLYRHAATSRRLATCAEIVPAGRVRGTRAPARSRPGAPPGAPSSHEPLGRPSTTPALADDCESHAACWAARSEFVRGDRSGGHALLPLRTTTRSVGADSCFSA